jgi:hypothetical protein
MKSECSNVKCKSKEIKKVISYNDGSDNINGIGHYHLECQQCGNNFNLWDDTVDKIKKVFGGNWKNYK